VLLLQYWDTDNSDLAGTIALNVKPSRDQSLLGTWAGMTPSGLKSATSIWLQVHARDFPVRDMDAFANRLNVALGVAHPLLPPDFPGSALEERSGMTLLDADSALFKLPDPDLPDAIRRAIAELT
jgi:hypothetical protein